MAQRLAKKLMRFKDLKIINKAYAVAGVAS
jgi:hypothetical protein